MGFGIWLVAGAVAFALARLVRAGRPRRWWPETLAALAAAAVAGLAATAMDFGGLREPDWRAASFAFLVSAALLGLIRVGHVVGVARERRR